ncbi:MAG: TonB-dependent receptor [Saprospiraceae bacterium]|nr:TonB-dependent receptor [Saprospiraceae bacterium]
MLRFFIVFLSLMIAFSVFGQTGTIRGYVYEKNTGNPVMFCNVFVDNTDIGASTDINGFYSISNLPEGSHDLSATYIGFDTAKVTVLLKKGATVLQNLYMNESSITLGEVKISAAREQAKRTVNISQITVTQKQIKVLPSAGGEADIAQYLQVLPGVVTTGDQGGQIFIRGGSPVQNKIMLDGLNIYNPFHSIGFFSIFETELIRSADVLTGGFSAEHGGRVSAIVDIKTREGNKQKFGGFVSAGPFMAKAMLEGPILKFNEKGSSLSYVFTGKKSLIENTSKNLYSFLADDPNKGLPFAFQDYYGKISLNTASGTKFNFFGFNFQDNYVDEGVTEIGWDNTGGGVNFSLVPQGTNVIVSGLLGISNYAIKIDEASDAQRTSDIDELTGNLDFTFFGNKNEIKYGMELKSVRTDFEFLNPFDVRLVEEQNTTEVGFYGKYKQILGKFIIEPSLRLQYYSSTGSVSVEPRFGFKYNVADNVRLKGAAGKYSQNILSTSNDKDVVNLFSGFLTTPEGPVLGLDKQVLDNKLQISYHGVFGVEYDLSDDIQINLEGYYKSFPGIIVVNRNKTSGDQPDYAVEDGKAYGIDFSVKYDLRKWYIWATYSHGYVNRWDGEQEYPTNFDRRHNANLLASYDIDKKGTFKVSARWNLGSGFPFTQTRGFHNYLDFLDGVSTPYTTENPDDVGVLYSEDRNGGRLPYYHRMDVSVQKNFSFTKYMGLEVTASVTNAYNRPNIFYFDRVSYRRVNQLPMIPSLSAKFYF